MTDFTTNLKLELPAFNVATWHDAVNQNFQIIDQFLFALTGVYVEGFWQHSTVYTVNQKILDSVDGRVYRVLVGHTSPSSGTFDAYRTANPTHWELVASSNDVGDIISAVTPAANKLIKFTSTSAATTIDITTFGQNLIDDANNAAARTTLGLGNVATETVGTSGDTIPKLNANNTHSGNFTVTGTFTSLGIDDNATAERMQITNTDIAIGATGSTGSFGIAHASDEAILLYGTSAARLSLYGGSHATDPNDIRLVSNNITVYQYDFSAQFHTFNNLAGDVILRAAADSARVYAGTAAIPGLNFAVDTDTGMYRISSNVIGFSTGGTLAASINASGDVTAIRDIIATRNVSAVDIAASNDITAGGDIIATGDVTAFSDLKLKKDVKTIEKALEKVNQLRGVEFLFKRNNQKSIGVIAQEVQMVVPEVVHSHTDTGTNEETLSVAYQNLVALLIEAIKELSTEVVELKEQINATP